MRDAFIFGKKSGCVRFFFSKQIKRCGIFFQQILAVEDALGAIEKLTDSSSFLYENMTWPHICIHRTLLKSLSFHCYDGMLKCVELC